MWVVKTHPARTVSTASANVRPSLTSCAHPLQAEEAGVALVGVEHLGVQAQRLQGAHPTDAEEDLLADAVLGVAAVQAVRHQRGRPGVLPSTSLSSR